MEKSRKRLQSKLNFFIHQFINVKTPQFVTVRHMRINASPLKKIPPRRQPCYNEKARSNQAEPGQQMRIVKSYNDHISGKKLVHMGRNLESSGPMED